MSLFSRFCCWRTASSEATRRVFTFGKNLKSTRSFFVCLASFPHHRPSCFSWQHQFTLIIYIQTLNTVRDQLYLMDILKQKLVWYFFFINKAKWIKPKSLTVLLPSVFTFSSHLRPFPLFYYFWGSEKLQICLHFGNTSGKLYWAQTLSNRSTLFSYIQIEKTQTRLSPAHTGASSLAVRHSHPQFCGTRAPFFLKVRRWSTRPRTPD